MERDSWWWSCLTLLRVVSLLLWLLLGIEGLLKRLALILALRWRLLSCREGSMLSSWWLVVWVLRSRGKRTTRGTLVVAAVIADRGSSFELRSHGLGSLIGIGLRPSCIHSSWWRRLPKNVRKRCFPSSIFSASHIRDCVSVGSYASQSGAFNSVGQQSLGASEWHQVWFERVGAAVAMYALVFVGIYSTDG